ncbi:MAG: hypothetical protein J6X86_03175 [Bacteroidales bacterium]|nr:hypothetical protein [Bacteroidales bacterium]
MKKIFFLLPCALLCACGNNSSQKVDNDSVVNKSEATQKTDTTALRAAVDKSLLEVTKKIEATNACVMVMDETGRLIMDYTVALHGDSLSVQKDRSGCGFEYGSLIKPMILAAIMDDPNVSLDTGMMLRVGSKIYDKGIKVQDHWDGPNDSLPLHRAFAVSSNVAMTELGEKFYLNCRDSIRTKLLRMLQYDNNVKIKAVSVLQDYYRLFYGVGIEMPATTVLRFYYAIANDGIVKSASGEPYRIMSSSTAQMLKAMLGESVCGGGIDVCRNDNAFSVAGKSAVIQPNVYNNYQTVCCVGFFPLEKPQYTVMVSIDCGGNYSHSYNASKVFNDVSMELMRQVASEK